MKPTDRKINVTTAENKQKKLRVINNEIQFLISILENGKFKKRILL